MVIAATSPPPEFPLRWVLVAFPFWWCFVLFVIARVGGWRYVAQRYPAGPDPPAGVTFRFRNGGLSAFGTGYRNCLNVTVAREGLYVVPMFPFRVFHTPALLPWSCVGSIKEIRFLGWRTLEVHCEVGKRVLRLYLPPEAKALLTPSRVPPPFPAA